MPDSRRTPGGPSALRMPAALITGATGFLGREILRDLLAREPDAHLVTLIRARDDIELAKRHRDLMEPLPRAHQPRVISLRGDIAQPEFGLSPTRYAMLAAHVDRVIHVAATTRFDHALDEARRWNVGGTAHVLALCRAIRARGGSGRLDHVSTAYVAGRRTGLVFEDELDVGQGFRNSYEQSKFEAERLCRDAAGELPIAIYRPSIIVGDATTGATTSQKGLYAPLRLLVPFYLRWRLLTGLVPLPLRRECPLDVVPVDFVAAAIATLYARPEAAGHCYHLAAGPDGAATIEDVARLACRYFETPRRRFISPRGPVHWFARAARPLLARLSPGLVRQIECYWPYTVANPRFDTSNARAAGLTPPEFAAYFPRLLAHIFGSGDATVRPAPVLDPRCLCGVGSR